MKEIMIGDAAKLVYLVDKLEQNSPQIGKTVVQKMMYILDKKGVVNYNYSLYHYGPYSPAVESDLNYIQFLGGVEINWMMDRGYLIKPSNNATSLEKSVSVNEKKLIDKVVKNFGHMRAKDLSLLTTIMYFWDRFNGNVDGLIEAVKSMKPKHSKEDIKANINLLEEKFFSESH